MTTAQHDLWAIRGIMADIDAEHDLSPAELRALLAILAPAHARVLAVYGPAQPMSAADLIWEVRGIMDEIVPEDMTLDELRQVAASLRAARDRVAPAPAKVIPLRLVRTPAGASR
jgi:hypothetical protein